METARKQQMLLEFRSNLDSLTAQAEKYEAFLEHCFRPLLLVLRHTPIYYVLDEKTQEECKFRQTLLGSFAQFLISLVFFF